MLDPRINQFDKAVRLRKESTDAIVDYWKDYSLYLSLEYWMMVAILVIPLILLAFKIDKSKIFLIGFFGYSVHVIFAYVDIFGINMGLWNYPFQVIPALPSLSIDSSLVPVIFMLIYQWTINHDKNFYLYSIIVAGIFAFIFKPLLVALGLFRMYGVINYFFLFICYVLVVLLAKLVTNVFLWLQKRSIKV
jgi:hypothetical protein